jgi:hypothetical protein
VVIAIGLAAPTFAGDPTKAKSKLECQRAGGMWDVRTNSCLRGLASANVWLLGQGKALR